MGQIQSILSYTTVDGPGTRCVVFFQGCPVGCVFCHNPDSWDPRAGEAINSGEVLRRLERYRPFLSTPGVTFSGGEPLMQPDFVVELARLCRSEGWHVALDTSGWGPPERFIEAVSTVDLVMISVKDPLSTQKICRLAREDSLVILEKLKDVDVPVWLRYVLISGLTDDDASLAELGRLAAGLPNLERLEILPFNSLAEDKWVKMGRDYPLEGVKPKVNEAQVKWAEKKVWEAYRRVKAGG